MENKSLKRIHPPAFKARLAIEAIKGEKTLAELTTIYGIHHSMIIKWKQAVLTGLENIFSDKKKLKENDDRELVSELYRQIGRLKVEVDFLKKRWEYLREKSNLKPGDLRLHIDKSIDLPIAVHAELLGISRASIYYQPMEISQEEVALMNKIDQIYTDCPFYGSRKIAKELTKQFIPVYPYLLKGLNINYPNQVWEQILPTSG